MSVSCGGAFCSSDIVGDGDWGDGVMEGLGHRSRTVVDTGTKQNAQNLDSQEITENGSASV
ncbi:uncharacterized protein G2W53_011420 [Senna tora]|uniref:Uncharacterized protein n=1 Tax=Senna tora TaxID=362788 RepID=A0A835CAL8_9FABA|nr:uncharacterized protein G2W53_011420 [Senna tora]